MLDVILNEAGEKTPNKGLFKSGDSADKPIKSIIKSFSWRIIGTLDTILISYILTGKLTLAISIGGVEVVTKTILYYFHERLWAHIHRIKLNVKKKSDEKRIRYNRIDQITQGKINRRIIRNTNVTVS